MVRNLVQARLAVTESASEADDSHGRIIELAENSFVPALLVDHYIVMDVGQDRLIRFLISRLISGDNIAVRYTVRAVNTSCSTAPTRHTLRPTFPASGCNAEDHLAHATPLRSHSSHRSQRFVQSRCDGRRLSPVRFGSWRIFQTQSACQ